jgi:DNA-binding response OmpR family regulator
VPRILVVEDHADVADLIDAVLTEEGYAVTVARDGAEGLLLARELQPDLILLDLHLPKVDGGTLLRSLRDNAATTNTPVVAMSAGANLRESAAELRGADAALSKPFDIEALLTQVRWHLDRRLVNDDGAVPD